MAAKIYEDQSGKKFKTHAEARQSNIKMLAKQPTVYLASVPYDASGKPSGPSTVTTNRRFASGQPVNEEMNRAVDAYQALTSEKLSSSSPANVPTPTYTNFQGAAAGAFSTKNAGFAIPEYGSVNPDGSVNKYNSQTGELLKDPAQFDSTGLKALQKEREKIEPPDTAKMYRDLEQQTRVREFQQQVNDYSGQLNAIKAKAEADQLSLEGQGRGQTTSFIGGEQARIAREAAIQALPVAAQLAVAQGNLGLAQQHLDTMFKIQVEDANNRYNHKMKLLDSAMNVANEEEKRRLQIYDKKLADKKDFDLIKARENSKQILGSAETGYFEYDPATKMKTPISGPTGDGTEESANLLAYTTAFQNGQVNITQIPQKLRGQVLAAAQKSGTNRLLGLLEQYRDKLKGLNLLTANFPQNKTILDTLKGQLTAEYKQQKQLGTLDAGVQKLIDKIVPDPSQFSLSALDNKAQVAAIDNFIANQGGTQGASGFNPDAARAKYSY